LRALNVALKGPLFHSCASFIASLIVEEPREHASHETDFETVQRSAFLSCDCHEQEMFSLTPHFGRDLKVAAPVPSSSELGARRFRA